MWQEYLNYLRDNPHGYWFKAKLYGWGWTPVTWQGWLVIASYVGVLVLLSHFLNEALLPRDVLMRFILPVVFCTIVLLCICYKKGEKPHWQWGLPKKGDDMS